MHVGHFLTRAALRWPHRPAWLEGDVVTQPGRIAIVYSQASEAQEHRRYVEYPNI